MSHSKLHVGQVLRYAREFDPYSRGENGIQNYWHVTHLDGAKRPNLMAGINPIAPVSADDGERRPAILISSSPHKVGSAETPWHDVFDADNGRIRYFGDAKIPGEDPTHRTGNKALLEAFNVHSSIDPDERASATPILFFQSTAVDGKRKGFRSFQGYGVIERVERISQFDPRRDASFANFVYDFAVLSMVDEDETFDWAWINARRDPSISNAECDALAPAAWRRWIRSGPSSIPRNRRQVSKLQITKAKDQLPAPGSKSESVLQAILNHYETKKHHFEGLAYAICRHMLSDSGGTFRDGWITPGGGDGGADFIARLDIGEGFGAVRQIVYGQAKCVAIKSGVDGKDIARTVARLKRGWFGAFVTTSYFSEPVQKEIVEDEYPLLLIGGLKVAETTRLLAEEHGFDDVRDYLEMLDGQFEGLKERKRPEEILH